jgi:hypothetical protein
LFQLEILGEKGKEGKKGKERRGEERRKRPIFRLDALRSPLFSLPS